MTDPQLKALQSYVARVCWFMLNHESGNGMTYQLLASKKQLETAFGVALPDKLQTQDFPDIL